MGGWAALNTSFAPPVPPGPSLDARDDRPHLLIRFEHERVDRSDLCLQTVRCMPLLFSYGSLQQEDVQLSTFGRRLEGQRDELPSFEPKLVKIDDPKIAAAVGRTHHANVAFNGNDQSRVAGMVFEVSEGELESVDGYEAAFSYERIAVRLASGRCAWLYVHSGPLR